MVNNANFVVDDQSLDVLNQNINFDFSNNLLYSSFYSQIFAEFDINCKYFSESTAAVALKNINSPFLSCIGINIQSLNSKYHELLNFLSNFNSKGIFLDILLFVFILCFFFCVCEVPCHKIGTP